MFVLDAKITIGDYTFKSIHDVEIMKSVEDMVDTAIIQLPTRFKIKGKDNVELFTEEAIKSGDKVTIELAYEGKYRGVEFEGYVKKVAPRFPLEIHCEDAMWLLRRKNINKAWNEGTTLKEILQEVVTGTSIKLAPGIPDINLDKWIIKNANGTQVLDSLKKQLAMTVFINDAGELYCGLQQFTNIDQVVRYDLNYNLVKNNLEFKRAEDRRIKVKYTYIDPENKRTSVTVGDEDGELRTFHTSVVSDESKLREMATAEIEKLKYDGYDGSVESFLLPYATRGMKASIEDETHPNRDGGYFIKSVKVTFGLSGARRIVKIGNRL
jgi:hypothetical protein